MEENAKLAEVDATVPDGPEPIVVSGGVVSALSTLSRGPLVPVSLLESTRLVEEVAVSARL